LTAGPKISRSSFSAPTGRARRTGFTFARLGMVDDGANAGCSFIATATDKPVATVFSMCAVEAATPSFLAPTSVSAKPFF